MRIKHLLDRSEQLLVYARWQGGLVDPSGDSTELLKVLAAGIRAGKAALLVHTDYIYPPIDSALWSAGACFHSLGPWLTDPLRTQGVSPDAIIELPMCIDAAPYKNSRALRDGMRAKLGIPPDAFAVLSVGVFDLAAKRHDYILAEIQKLADQNIFWVVAGSRGRSAVTWPDDARRTLGPRFIPLHDVPFAEMHGIYAAADLFASASLYETFGLVYLEAQMAGLPCVVHDTPITRHLFAQLPEHLKSASLIDMRRPGATAAAISCWIALAADPTRRDATQTALADFASAQERRFGWQAMSPHYAAAFERISHAGASVRVVRQTAGTADEQYHRQGVQLFEQGKLSDAVTLLGRALAGRETAERWNDWATVQSALANARDAEQGFRRALALDPSHAQAAANLGAVLTSAGHFSDAIPFLESAIARIDQNQRDAIARLLQLCRTKQSATPILNEAALTAFLKSALAQRTRQNTGKSPNVGSDQIAYCAALLKQIPVAAFGQRLLGIGPHGDLLTSALGHFHAYQQIELRPAQTGFFDESRWPFPDAHFDVLVFSKTLETLADDPMRAMSEINRVLKLGGTLILTAPNIGSAKSLHALLRGGAPYIDGRFSVAPHETRSHREYTASEIETLAVAAGFGKIGIETRSIFWRPMDALMPSLAASGFSVASRGDTLFLRARKDSAVRDRFPSKLYDLSSPEAQKLMAPVIDAPMRILIIFETLPLPDGGGADHRLLQVIRLLRDEGHSVTFLAPRSTGNGLRASLLKDLGMDVFLEDSEVLRAEGIDLVSKWTLQQVFREGQFDLAIVSLWFWMGVTLPEHYLDEIRCLSPLTRVAVLTDDCHGIREQGGAEISGLWSDRERAADFAEREMEAYRRSDLVICISESDKEKIARQLGPAVPIEVLPMMIDAQPQNQNNVILSEAKDPSSPFSLSSSSPSSSSPSSSFPPFDHREGIVYLGHFNNPPTLDGLEWYIREVAPLVRKSLPDLKLYVVGAGLPEDWSSSDPNVIRLGFKLDLTSEFAQRRILVSPVRFGTGIKTKNLHALANGLPIVTNAKGAEGAGLISGETAFITDDPAEFAAAVVNLYTDAALWTDLSENSRTHAQRYFSKEAMQAALRRIVNHARSLKPQPYDSSHIWSMRLVETMFADVLNYQPARQRHNIRVLAYARVAEQILAQGNAAEARRQLRHVFNYFSHSVSRSIFFNSFLSVAESMERTYRAIGEIDGAREFRREARSINPDAFPESEPSAHVSTRQALPSAAPTPPAYRTGEITEAPAKNITLSEAKPRRNKRNNATKLDISVIVPTYNRASVLRECLDALKRQSLSPHRFEVIVVDDGSTDGTRLLCSNHGVRHEFRYFAQPNAGAGAARRVGVDYAKGKYLLFINDDTIASPTLLARHLDLHRSRNHEKLAVLGNFKLPKAAKNHALTWFLATQPFLFPQVGLKPGLYAHHSFFITCNVSVRRDLVLAAGSFDPDFRVAEDTELGIRLIQKGLKILYAPELESIHQHLDFTIPDLIRRAEVYGNKLVQLFRKHPTLLAGGRGVLGTLDANSLKKINVFIDQHQAEIPAAVESLSKFDSIDFSPFFDKQLDRRNAADAVMDLFTRCIPVVYWYHLFRSFLAAREAEISSPIPAQPGNIAAQSADL